MKKPGVTLRVTIDFKMVKKKVANKPKQKSEFYKNLSLSRILVEKDPKAHNSILLKLVFLVKSISQINMNANAKRQFLNSNLFYYIILKIVQITINLACNKPK